MKKHLLIIFATLLIICAFTGCVGQRILAGQSGLPEQRNISNANNTPVATGEQGEMPDNSFSEEDYQKLLALQFDGYMNMTITNYRNCVAELTDTAEYKELLERFSKSETLYELKDTNETASFLFYILPLAGDEWKSRSYTGEVTGADNARLEYSFTLTVLDADRLMIKDYNDVRLSVMETMQVILMNQVKEELRNDAAMQAYIQAYVNDFLPYMQTSELSVAIEFAYFPSQAAEEEQQGSELDNRGELETRRYSNGTKDDYRSLLALKTPDYQDMSIADFNSALLEWANEDHERMERIDEDIKWNDFPVTLTAEELYFVKMTVFLSSMENGKAIQSIYTGTEPYSPYYGEYLQEKITVRDAARCSLYYQFSYSISEAEAVTVGVRDRQIEGMINAVQTFWSDTDIKSALKMNEGDIVEELEKIAAAYSTDHITININKEKIHWERMDERAEIEKAIPWNPWHGCKRVSQGCKNCFVYKMDQRYGRDTTIITKGKTTYELKDKDCPPNSLVKLCFSSDFFIEEADEWRTGCWDFMRRRKDCIFVTTTKRPERIKNCVPSDWEDGWEHIHISISIENQEMADTRLKYFLEAPVKHREVFCSPLIGPISLGKYLDTGLIKCVNVGGEMAPKADVRPIEYEWVKNLYLEAKERNIEFYFHQSGSLFLKDGINIGKWNLKEQIKCAEEIQHELGCIF